MSEIEPVKPRAIVEELAHHQGQVELLQEKMSYHLRKIEACEKILRMSNVI